MLGWPTLASGPGGGSGDSARAEKLRLGGGRGGPCRPAPAVAGTQVAQVQSAGLSWVESERVGRLRRGGDGTRRRGRRRRAQEALPSRVDSPPRVTTNTLWPQRAGREMALLHGEEGAAWGLLSPGGPGSPWGAPGRDGGLGPLPSASSVLPSGLSLSLSPAGVGARRPVLLAQLTGSSGSSSSGWGSGGGDLELGRPSCSCCCLLPLRTSTKLRLQPFWISSRQRLLCELFTCRQKSGAGPRRLWVACPQQVPGPPPAGREEPAHRLLLGLTVEVQTHGSGSP